MASTMTSTIKAAGFAVICPFCRDADEPVTLNLRDLREVTCPACGETFTAQQAAARARELADAWGRVASWIESAPIVGE
jgi:hypothetical protein